MVMRGNICRPQMQLNIKPLHLYSVQLPNKPMRILEIVVSKFVIVSAVVVSVMTRKYSYFDSCSLPAVHWEVDNLSISTLSYLRSTFCNKLVRTLLDKKKPTHN